MSCKKRTRVRRLNSALMFGCYGVSFVLAASAVVAASENNQPWLETALPEHLDNDAAYALDDAALIAHGEVLFATKFNSEDGAGRPLATQGATPTRRRYPATEMFQRLAGPDASACSSCHHDPVVGGAGDVTANAFVSDGFTAAEFDSLDPQFSRERNTNHLFGAGLIELLAREMTAELQAQRAAGLEAARANNAPVKVDLSAKGVEFGSVLVSPDGLVDVSALEGVDPDLIVRPFSQKGVFASLRLFSVNAMNDHHGMQAEERYGARWTGQPDFDGDGAVAELSEGDITALVAWQASLEPPLPQVPDNPRWAELAKIGKAQFAQLGCADCHIPALPLDSLVFTDPGPYDGAGTLRQNEAQIRALDLGMLEWAKQLPRDKDGRVLVPLFGDLKRHVITDNRIKTWNNELLAQAFVPVDTFATAELWGVADTAPYGHRGHETTLDAAILAHGGEGRAARDAYEKSPDAMKEALIAYLKTLKMPKGVAPIGKIDVSGLQTTGGGASR